MRRHSNTFDDTTFDDTTFDNTGFHRHIRFGRHQHKDGCR